jgi:predicted nuclease of predicted toxin-antitoxin system
MLLYADEDFPFPAVEELRRLGHDVITAQEDGRTATPDPDVLARAHNLGRAVVTYNRRHYERLDRQGAPHIGIVTAKQDRDHAALAARIHDALAGRSAARWCIRVNRPPAP